MTLADRPRGYLTNALAFTWLSLSLGLAASAGCADEIDRLTDCQDICGRYADCFDASYDVDGCRSDCRDSAANSADFDQRVDECENCLDDRSCSSSAFNCAAECAGIVP